MRKSIYGWAVIIGIVGGIVLDVWIQAGSAPVLYANEGPFPEDQPEVILIGTSIDWTEDRIKKEIKEVFGTHADLMIKVAWCESRLVADAVGPTSDYGVFQLHEPSHDLSEIDVFNPADNIRFAKKLFDESGLQPWNASRFCWYNYR